MNIFIPSACYNAFHTLQEWPTLDRVNAKRPCMTEEVTLTGMNCMHKT